jgi:hypothetical protein
MSITQENESALDVIARAVSETFSLSGERFLLYDDFGALRLKNIANMATDFLFTKNSGVISFDVSSEIDTNTYAAIKILRPAGRDFPEKTFYQQDNEAIKKWGNLQLFKKIGASVNDARALVSAENLLKSKCRELKSLRLTSLGIPELRAGNLVFVDLKDAEISGQFLINKMTRRITASKHTMEMELVEWLT